MPLARLENFLKNLNGNTLYVDPNELDASDSIENRGNSKVRPFKTIQRALIEAANFAYVAGSNNDLFDQTTIMISPGTHYIDNRPGYYYSDGYLYDVNGALRTITELSVNSNFNINESTNQLYIYNSVDGGVILPKGVSLVASDLRKTKIRPKFVPDPNNDNIKKTAIFRVTGGSYIFGFSIYDGNPTGGVYNTYTTNTVNPTFSHHKLTAFEYADGKNKYTKNGVKSTKTDLETYYYKLSLGYGTYSGRPIPDNFSDFQPNPEENKIVGDLGQGAIEIDTIISGDGTTASQTITVTTKTEHNLTPLTPIQINGVASTSSIVGAQQYNGTFVVAQVSSPNVFTYLLTSAPIVALPTGNSNPQVKVLSDTVSSSSPYVFNCSLKSVYGMNGIHADGSKATGFKSLVTAQFTGISLQRDDRAFLKYNDTSGVYQSQSELGSAVSLHQDSNAVYRPGWESTHIKASNDAFIQCVSIFAIGYAKQFVAESGGDQSITNSNSNFGAIALHASGFKEYQLPKDDHGFITHIIPPKDSTTLESNINCYSIDVEKTTSYASANGNTRVYLNGYTDQFSPPKTTVRGYTIGARDSDKLYFPGGETSATISPNYEVVKTIDSINLSTNTITVTGDLTGITTYQAVRVISNTGILPDGIEHNKIYYARDVDTNTLKLSENIKGVGISSITSIIGTEIADNLKLVSRVSDAVQSAPGSPIQWDSYTKNWYISIESNSTFISELTGIDNPTFFLKRKIDDRTLDDKVYRVRLVIPKESDNASEPNSGFIIQNSSFAVDSNYSTQNSSDLADSNNPDKLQLIRNQNVVIDAWTTGITTTANIITRKPHGLKVGNKVNIYNLKSTNEPSPVGLGTGTGFNGKFVVSEVVSDLQFKYFLDINPGTIDTITNTSTASWLDKRNCNLSEYRVPPYTILSSNRDNLPYFTCEEINNDYQVYKVKTIQKYSQESTDGIYHLYLNVFKNTPTDSNFALNEYKLSQNLDNIYPQSDVDNVISDVESAASVASRQTIGKVDVNNPRLSTTKETIINYLKDFNDAYSVSGITKDGNTCTITTNSNHQLNGVRSVNIIASGSGYVNGTYYDIPLCPTGVVAGENATANLTVSGGVVTSITIANPGSGYSLNDQLKLKGIPGSTSETTCSAVSLLPQNIGAVQILGSIYPENNGVFRITSSTKNTVSYTNSSGRTEANSTAAAIICIPVYSISSVGTYDTTNNTTTITTDTNSVPTNTHPFLAGNTVLFDGVAGKFTVSEVTSRKEFIVVGDATGATAVYSSGLTSQPKDTNASNENANSRQFTIVDGFVAIINDSAGISSSDTTIGVTSPTGLNKGDFIQIEDEIMLVSRVSGTNIRVIRGVLGTTASLHADKSAIRRIKINAIELRRNSILRASGHTFEYTGFGPGNYSTGMPTNQDRVLTNDEVLISQSLPTHGGLVVYTGMNSNGEFFIGRKKYDATTGEEISLTPTTETETSFIDNLTVNTITVNNKLDASTAFVKIKELTVGIATVTDKLSVSGIATFSSGMEVTGISTFNSDVYIDGNLYVTQDITAFYTPSDRNWKDNITPIPDALNKVLLISGNTFDWNEKSNQSGKDAGVIAQEVQEVLPEAVVKREDGHLSVSYTRIVPLLIEAIKDLKAEIEKLKGGN